MNKNKNLVYTVLGIIFILFNIIIFAIPINKNGNFWIGYVFTIIAFGIQTIIAKNYFEKGVKLKSKLLGYPIIYVGIMYFSIQLVTFGLFILISGVQSWILVIIYALILGVSLVLMISTKLGKEKIVRVEEKIEQKVNYIKELQLDIEIISEKEENVNIKNELKKLAEKVRYSDPMSNEKLVDIEKEICDKVQKLKNGEEDKVKIINEIDMLITERNKKCKIYK